jgi:hypothetical protein
MNQLERTRKRKGETLMIGPAVLASNRFGGRKREHRTEALAAGEDAVAHGVAQNLRTRRRLWKERFECLVDARPRLVEKA